MKVVLQDIDSTFQDTKPGENDLNGAKVAINRLINAYLFPIEDVMIGKFNADSRSICPLDGAESKHSMSLQLIILIM